MTIIKPGRWPLFAAGCRPEWRWFWGIGAPPPAIFHPLWQQAGNPEDLAPAKNKGVLPGSPSNPEWTANGLFFDEVDDYYTVADAPALTFPDGPFTLAFYMDVPDNSGAWFKYFFSWGNYDVTPSINVYFGEASYTGGNARKLQVRARDNDGSLWSQISTNEYWPATGTGPKIIIIVRDGSNNFNMYVDGNDEGSQLLSAFDAIDRSDSLNIGRRVDGNTVRMFGGDIFWWGKWDYEWLEERIMQVSARPAGAFERVRPFGGVLSLETGLTASGDLNSQPASLSGQATKELIATGALSAQPSALDGAASVEKLASGVLQAQAAQIDGTASVISEVFASGDLVSAPASLSGEANVSKISYGALAASPASIAGTAAMVRSASGALISGDAQISGFASLIGEQMASGDLLAGVSTVVGVAKVGIWQPVDPGASEIWQPVDKGGKEDWDPVDTGGQEVWR